MGLKLRLPRQHNRHLWRPNNSLRCERAKEASAMPMEKILITCMSLLVVWKQENLSENELHQSRSVFPAAGVKKNANICWHLRSFQTLLMLFPRTSKESLAHWSWVEKDLSALVSLSILHASLSVANNTLRKRLYSARGSRQCLCSLLLSVIISESDPLEQCLKSVCVSLCACRAAQVTQKKSKPRWRKEKLY